MKIHMTFDLMVSVNTHDLSDLVFLVNPLITNACKPIVRLLVPLLAMSSGDVEKGATEGDGWVHPEGEMAKLSLGLAMKSGWSKEDHFSF